CSDPNTPALDRTGPAGLSSPVERTRRQPVEPREMLAGLTQFLQLGPKVNGVRPRQPHRALSGQQKYIFILGWVSPSLAASSQPVAKANSSTGSATCSGNTLRATFKTSGNSLAMHQRMSALG